MEKPAGLPFSLPAFLIAPWPMPLLCSAAMAVGNPGRDPLFFFLLCLGVSLTISYLGLATLVICLWFVGKVRPITRAVTVILGTALAASAYLPFCFVAWGSSGPDSGPPEGSFLTYLIQNFASPILGLFLAGGIVAAFTYDILARRHARAR